METSSKKLGVFERTHGRLAPPSWRREHLRCALDRVGRHARRLLAHHGDQLVSLRKCRASLPPLRLRARGAGAVCQPDRAVRTRGDDPYRSCPGDAGHAVGSESPPNDRRTASLGGGPGDAGHIRAARNLIRGPSASSRRGADARPGPRNRVHREIRRTIGSRAKKASSTSLDSLEDRGTAAPPFSPTNLDNPQKHDSGSQCQDLALLDGREVEDQRPCSARVGAPWRAARVCPRRTLWTTLRSRGSNWTGSPSRASSAAPAPAQRSGTPSSGAWAPRGCLARGGRHLAHRRLGGGSSDGRRRC